MPTLETNIQLGKRILLVGSNLVKMVLRKRGYRC